MKRLGVILVLALVVAVGAAYFFLPEPKEEEVISTAEYTCDRTIGPGTDTLQNLVNTLQPGEVGCLRAGVYTSSTRAFQITSDGTSTARKTIAAYPGEKPEIRGSIRLRANNWNIGPGLYIHGQYGPVMSSTGNKLQNCFTPPECVWRHADATLDVGPYANITITGNFVTNRDPNWNEGPYTDANNNGEPDVFERAGTCAYFGGGGQQAKNVVVEKNVIYRCGELLPDDYLTNDNDPFPQANNLEHCIYGGHLDESWIRDNLIYDCANRGIQVYPNVSNTRIDGNIVDMAVFASGGSIMVDGQSCNNNIIENNVVTNVYTTSFTILGRNNCSPVTNVVRNNATCVRTGGSCSGGISGSNSFTACNNIAADPRYVDRAQLGEDAPPDQTDYRIQNEDVLAKYTGTYAGLYDMSQPPEDETLYGFVCPRGGGRKDYWDFVPLGGRT